MAVSSRTEWHCIAQWLLPESRVLNLGCGDGGLLAFLTEQRHIDGFGVDIDLDCVATALGRGLSVLHLDLEQGLPDFEDNSFDTVVINQTLQTLHHGGTLMRDMLRVGREVIVGFPNFGYWRCRGQLALRGQMPILSGSLPYA